MLPGRQRLGGCKAATLDLNEAVSKMEKSKEDFQSFIVAACQSHSCKGYKELYMFLLKCFTEADNEGTGKIGPDKFDALVDITAVEPRRFGFAPSAAETVMSVAEKLAARKAMFDKMDTDGSGFISFEEWLTFSYSHICEKAKTLDPALSGSVPAQSAGRCPYGFDQPTKASNVPQVCITSGPCPMASQSGLAAAETTREGFITFIKKATQSQLSSEYRELYQFLLKCFTAADSDFDGKVRLEDFDDMVEVAANLPRRFR